MRAGTGREPILYTEPGFWNYESGFPSLAWLGTLWIANWQVSCPTLAAGFTGWQFWQYDDKGTAPGLGSNDADLDKFNGTLDDLHALAAMSTLRPGAIAHGRGSVGTERRALNVGGVVKLVAVLAVTLGTGCASAKARAPRTADDRSSAVSTGTTLAATSAGDAVFHDIRGTQVGLATWYGGRLAGHRTASGERFDPRAMTAAHLSLPLGTWVEVRRTDGEGPAVRVRINDRGPYGDSRRIIDLSKHAADLLGITRKGTAEVSVRLVAGP